MVALGTKDHPQKSNLLVHGIIATGVVLLSSIGGYLAYDKITELDRIVEKQDKSIVTQGKKLEEQGSLIDQQKKDIESLQGENAQLQTDLGNQKQDYENRLAEKDQAISGKDGEIDSLKKKLAAKQAAAKEAAAKAAQESAKPKPSPAPTPVSAPAKKEEPAQQAAPTPKQDAEPAGREIIVEATAYTAHPSENGGTYGGAVLTATGFNLSANPSAKVIAVDPSVIPLGSRVWVEGYGEAMALDTGGAIKGNRIDVLMPNDSISQQWGRKQVRVKILG